ncbi:hypothetical protein WG219_10035 [Ectopseudomonas mendocina]|uniref:Uncharacterized protein n=1 Tax=Ectopseudomonas mendocina TaxID=300 RepID=A0ABZ2RMW9_ECTME
MRLNGSALNERRLNAGRRVPVLGSGQALFSVSTEILARRVVHGTGAAVKLLAGDFLASAVRRTTGEWVTLVNATLIETVARNGSGEAVFNLAADLFYSRTVLGSGFAVFGLEMLGHVGIVFIEGEAFIRPMQVEMTSAKRVMVLGAADIAVGGSLMPSAIRLSVVELVPSHLTGDLEASHIDAAGVRHIGFSGGTPLELDLQDSGMLRQAFVGSLDFELLGSGSGSLIKPTLAGAAEFGVQVLGGFHAIRPISGLAVLEQHMVTDGAVIVRGEGIAVLSLLTFGTGYKRTYPDLEATIVRIDSSMSGTRVITSSGAAVTELEALGVGVRRRVGRGTAVFDFLGESDSYINPNAFDPTEEIFSRLVIPRNFVRLPAIREWRR